MSKFRVLHPPDATDAVGSRANVPIRLLICDDQAIVRSGLRLLLEPELDIQIVAEARDGIEALQLAEECRPDVALIDVVMPKLDGLATLVKFRAEHQHVKVVVYSGFSNSTFGPRSTSLGAAAFIHKNDPFPQLVETIRRAAAGKLVWNRDKLRRLSGSRESIGADVEIKERRR